MFLSALRSIKDDFSRSLFYWLTFILTSMFMFLFFHLSYSDIVGVKIINSQNNIATTLTVLDIAICMIVIFFANDFYVKKKSQSIAIRLVVGGTYFQIVQYLLFQTFFLFLLAIPVGILCACLCMPLINTILEVYLHSQANIGFRLDAIVSTVVILVFEIIWCTILNLGYAYRHSIKSLLDNEKTQVKLKVTTLYHFHISPKVMKWGSLLLFVVPVILFYIWSAEPSNLLFLSIIGMIGLYLSIEHFVIPQINDFIQNKWINHKLKLIYYGFLRNNFIFMKKNIILLIVSDILILALLISTLQNPIEVMLAMISFVIINVLLSLSIMFCYSTEIVGRKKLFQSIERLGYMKNDQKKIIFHEVIGLYGFIIGVSLFYICNIFIVLYIHDFLHIYLILGMLAGFLLPLIICGFLNYIYYLKQL